MNETLKRACNVVGTTATRGRALKSGDRVKNAGAEDGTTVVGRGATIRELARMVGVCRAEDREEAITNDRPG